MAALISPALLYDSGQAQHAMAAMNDAGAHTVFTLTTKPWSQAAGYEYTVVPYGLATGGEITPGSGNDNVQTAALTAYMAAATGASATTGLLSVAADTSVAVTRGASSNTHAITSITVDATGAIASVAGTASTAFSETRAAAGGPPLIPVGSIEIGQVRTTSVTAAPITAEEIFQVWGVHQERWDFPIWNENPVKGEITFAAALPLIHTGGVAKKVFARVATPIFSEISHTRGYVPADNTASVSSEQYYDGTVGSISRSLGQCSFDVLLKDGTTDALLARDNTVVTLKFFPDKNKLPYQITQGVMSVSRTFEYGKDPAAKITISPSQATVNFAS